MNYSGPNSSGHLSLTFGKGSNPPNLADYSDEPKYDLTTVVQIVRVRPMILWGWEQQLGIPSPMRVQDDPGSGGRRYSERDLVASLWLREQILNGISPNEAAARLLGPDGTRRFKTGPLAGSGSGSLSAPPEDGQRGRVNSGPFGENGITPRSAKPTRRLSDLDPLPGSGPLVEGRFSPTSGPLGSNRPGTSGSGRLVPGDYTSPTSGPLPGSGPLRTGAPGSNALGVTYNKPEQHVEHRVGGFAYQPPAPATTFEPTRQTAETNAPGVRWSGPGSQQGRGRELRVLLPQFIRAFSNFDTPGANYILTEALSSRSVETVCLGLVLPALTRLGDLNSRHEISAPEERFALNYAKSFLYSIYYRTPERSDGPLTFVGCGPKELGEINALTLAVFWRRAGLRVIYLGQDIGAESLVEEVRKRRPALVSLTVTGTQRIRSLARLAKVLSQLDAPRPFVGFSGPVFVRNPELQRRVNGVYLGDDAATATWHVTNLLGTDRGAIPNSTTA